MKKILKLLDEDDLKIIQPMNDYEHHMMKLMDNEETFVEKYRDWTIANEKQLEQLYFKQIAENNPIAVGNALPVWAHFMYAVWDMNFNKRKLDEMYKNVDNEIDNMINSL